MLSCLVLSCILLHNLIFIRIISSHLIFICSTYLLLGFVSNPVRQRTQEPQNLLRGLRHFVRRYPVRVRLEPHLLAIYIWRVWEGGRGGETSPVKYK